MMTSSSSSRIDGVSVHYNRTAATIDVLATATASTTEVATAVGMGTAAALEAGTTVVTSSMTSATMTAVFCASTASDHYLPMAA